MTIPAPTVGRHRLENLTKPRLVALPPKHSPSTSHRRRRTQLMQVSVYDLVARHSIARMPWWYRAARFLGAWAVNVMTTEAAR